MSEEIDLKYYLSTTLRAWRFVVLVTLLAAGLAYGISSLLPRMYRAGATVVATSARTTIQFDARIDTQAVQISSRGYPDLAMSDELLQKLLLQLQGEGIELDNLKQLRNLLDASALSDPALIHLSVMYKDPQTAAKIADDWADLFITWMNEVYGATTQEQVGFFEERLADAEADWSAALADLSSFQARNRLLIIRQQMDNLAATQSLYLADQRQKNLLLQNVRSLQQQLETEPANVAVVGDQLATLFLQLKAYNAEPNASLQINIDPQAQSFAQSSQELGRVLSTLAQGIEAQVLDTTNNLALLEPEILSLQAEQQNLQNELDRLTEAEQIAQETYLALAHKVDEERITLQDADGGFRLVSRAVPPTNAARPLKLLNTAIAFVFGLLLSLLGTVVYAWWQINPARAGSPASK